ncbi:MAG TPA: hypothetical protein VM487_13775 [Phycisphaerae bacterium]|nr:hypothetical protein [Phycisphaerae bacterium]
MSDGAKATVMAGLICVGGTLLTLWLLNNVPALLPVRNIVFGIRPGATTAKA